MVPVKKFTEKFHVINRGQKKEGKTKKLKCLSQKVVLKKL